MPPFRFRLEPVRRLRQAERDELRGQLSDAYRAAEVLEQQRAGVNRELAELRTQHQSAASAMTIDVAPLLEAQRYEMVLRGQATALEEKIKLVEAEVDRRRDAVANAERAVKTLDKLEEKQAGAHSVLAERALAKQMDETAITEHARRDRETAGREQQ